MNLLMRICWCGLSATLLLIVGCTQKTIDLTENGKAIQLIKHPEQFPQECIFLGEIKTMAVKGASSSYQNALNKIKNEVAKIDGTHMRLVDSITDEMSTFVYGEAYRCSGKSKTKDSQSTTNQDSWIIID